MILRTSKWRIALASVFVAILATVLVACGGGSHNSVACAATMEGSNLVIMAPAKTSGGTSGHSTSGGSSRYGSTGSTSGGSKAKVPAPPAKQNTTSGGSTSGSTTSGSSGSTGSTGSTGRYGTSSGTTSTTGSTSGGTNARVPSPPSSGTVHSAPGESSYTPPRSNVQQPQGDINAVRSSAPQRFSTSSSSRYTSPVTHHVYLYHNASYFSTLGWHDPYDPYDPYNWTNRWSPWYGYHFNWVSHC